ncbi:SLC13 family permease [Corynebacterium sputi]|uniref:SLC13 family permease n=1 Tax=Corynebacterium sputi TaxID=489915 RepID=UPI0003F81B17|nr:SLC13 family permease [Corynebacterium sputi]
MAHLDGAGASTFLITIPAMLPLYERMGMSRLVLATCVALCAGVMNILPWGGPTLRAAATADIPANELWGPVIPAQILGIVLALVVAFYLGVREKRRLARLEAGDVKAEVPESTARVGENGMVIVGPDGNSLDGLGTDSGSGGTDADSDDGDVVKQEELEAQSLKRPKLLFVNLAITVIIVAGLVSGIIDPAVCFIIGAITVLVVNYPNPKEQAKRINAHASAAVLMASTLLAAGGLLGVLAELGMVEAMAQSGASLLPENLAPGLLVIMGILGVPLNLVFGPDAYYFGVMGVGAEFGVDGTDIAMASILGQETVGFPISPMTGSFYLLVGLANVSIGRHIKHAFFWLWLVSVVMVLAAVLMGVIPGWV